MKIRVDPIAMLNKERRRTSKVRFVEAEKESKQNEKGEREESKKHKRREVCERETRRESKVQNDELGRKLRGGGKMREEN